VIRDLATHKPSQHIYLSVSRGRGSDAKPTLIRVSRSGELAEVALNQARFAKAMLLNTLGAIWIGQHAND
jgi:hypothetical protein